MRTLTQELVTRVKYDANFKLNLNKLLEWEWMIDVSLILNVFKSAIYNQTKLTQYYIIK